MPPDDVAVAPSLPLPLPEFEGRLPVGVVTAVNGHGQRISRAMHYGEKVVLVVEAEVVSVGHKKTTDGMKRVHGLAVEDLYELEGKPGAVLVRSLRQAHRIADDQRSGVLRHAAGLDQPEPAGGITVTVDGNGTVLTDAEVAAMRGEVLPGLPHVDVAVLVFADGSRALWPDDFPGATGPHPEAGESIRKPGAKAKDDPTLVSAVLDADTGETLEEWTDEQEAARLLELEQEAAREEARQDREVHEELLAGRDRAQWMVALESVSTVVIDGQEYPGMMVQGVARGDVVEVSTPSGTVSVRADAIKDGRLLLSRVTADAEVELDPSEFDGAGPLPEAAAGPDKPDEEVSFEDEPAGGTEVELDPARLAASQLLSDPISGSYRAIGSVKSDLPGITDRAVVLAAAEIERNGKARKGLLEALDRRAAELFSAHEAVPTAEIPASPEAFEVPEVAAEVDEFADPEEV